MSANHSSTGKILAIVGVWLQLGLVFGLLGTVFAMSRSFNELSSGDEIDPTDVSNHIIAALYFTWIGSSFCIIGLFLIGISLFVFQYREGWLFNFLTRYGFVLLFLFPVGTVIGIGLIALSRGMRNCNSSRLSESIRSGEQ